MSGEDDACEALGNAAMDARSALVAAVTWYRSIDGAAPIGIIEAMQHTGNVILAAEAIADAAGAIAKELRSALARVMIETGCPQVRLANHTVSVTEPRPKLACLDPQALPPELLKQPPPVPDMDKIKAAHAAGAQITGVAMLNGGAPFVSFKTRKD